MAYPKPHLAPSLPEGGDYPFDLTKTLPLVMNGNRQMVPVDYFFNNDLKYLQGGISTMTYTTSTIKTNATQYDLQGIKDMVPNIWSPVKVAYDKYKLWEISHWRKQRKTFYAYVRGLESSHDVYSTKHILAVTRVEVMRKHRIGSPISRAMMSSTLLLHYECSPESWLFRIESKIFNWESKNIRLEYLPQRRWSSLEKKRAHFMIKAINKKLKERRMMRSFEKFVGGRLQN
ncbi:hypothetical protein Tco_1071533 [Tanacetum coccineum]